MSLGEHPRPVTHRDLQAIDEELHLLVKVRNAIKESGRGSSALWFDQLLDERSGLLDHDRS